MCFLLLRHSLGEKDHVRVKVLGFFPPKWTKPNLNYSICYHYLLFLLWLPPWKILHGISLVICELVQMFWTFSNWEELFATSCRHFYSEGPRTLPEVFCPDNIADIFLCFLNLDCNCCDKKLSSDKIFLSFTTDTFLCNYQVLLGNYPVFDLNHRFWFWFN